MTKLIENLSKQFKYFKNNIFLYIKISYNKLNKIQIIKNLKTNIFNTNNFLIKHYIITISFISYFFLIVYSPIFSLMWLCLPSLYFLYNLNYKDFFWIWGITLFIWHFIFTFIFLDFGPIIIIGGDHTKKLIDYLLLNDANLWFTGLCYQTIYIFDLVSQKTGFLICIPLAFPIKKTSCMPNDNNNTPKPKKSWYEWGTAEPEPAKQDFPERKKGWLGREIVEPAKEDFQLCANMVDQMERHSINRFTKSHTRVSRDGKRTVTASQTYVPIPPFWYTRISCTSMELSKKEIDLIKSRKSVNNKK